MIIILCILMLIVGGAVGWYVGRLGRSANPASSQPTVETGFQFDPRVVGSISDETWLKMRDDPNLVRQYIDTAAFNSQKLQALRKGLIAARKTALGYYAKGDGNMGEYIDDQIRGMERQCKKLEAGI